MKQDRRSLRALANLLPSGVLGLSAGLAAADAVASPSPAAPQSLTVAQRLQSLRTDVVDALGQNEAGSGSFVAVDADQRLAWWGNGGWRNGGWRNGGWGNGGWHNGWHNW
jgi:rSAM-associated Gly-rich repeat protein